LCGGVPGNDSAGLYFENAWGRGGAIARPFRDSCYRNTRLIRAGDRACGACDVYRYGFVRDCRSITGRAITLNGLTTGIESCSARNHAFVRECETSLFTKMLSNRTVVYLNRAMGLMFPTVDCETAPRIAGAYRALMREFSAGYDMKDTRSERRKNSLDASSSTTVKTAQGNRYDEQNA
jgi:hypothetical protein